ncbi:hypothetical protein K1719_010538 [Acacia pycnantha]|nr:hypothetical protein K1719_010538 [Acacia pycnantha]
MAEGCKAGGAKPNPESKEGGSIAGEDPGDSPMEVGKSLDQDVWHVVHKPGHNLEGDYVQHQEKGSGVAVAQPIVTPQNILQIDHSVRNTKGKKGKNQSKKHPRIKATSNSSESVPVSSQDLRNDKRSRESTLALAITEQESSSPSTILNESITDLSSGTLSQQVGKETEAFIFGEKKEEKTLQVEKGRMRLFLGIKRRRTHRIWTYLMRMWTSFSLSPMIQVNSGFPINQLANFGMGRGACSRNLIHHLRIACKGKWPMLLILSETKTDSPSRFHCLERLGYDGLAFIPSLGRSGGLVAVWRSGQGSVSLIRSDRQFLHLHVSLKGRNPFLLTAIYAVPSPSCKLLLWQELLSLSSSVSAPWVVLGDFNDILTAAERVGGSGINRQRISQFQERVNDCHLSDLGFVGPKFTWKGPCLPNCARLFERLDRALAIPG